jgi:transmembrane sensor
MRAVHHVRGAPAPAVLDATAIEGGSVTLADGSHIAVSEGGRVRVVAVNPREVELALEAGSVVLDVPHADRRVTVHAGRYDVIDQGTRYRVSIKPEGEVTVGVTEGSVEVRSRSGTEATRRLSAGDEWSNVQPLAAMAPPSPAATAPPSAPGSTGLAAPAAALALGATSARDLLELAERQRLAGNPRGAASALDTLRHRHRGDPRAALAAFELGRLRLDALGDPAGAAEALGDSIAIAPTGPLREDAEARRVEALDLAHSAECPAARDAFLARHPHSIHRAVVAGRCAGL